MKIEYFPATFPLIADLLETFEGNDAAEGTSARDYYAPLFARAPDLSRVEEILGTLLPGERDTLVLGNVNPRPGIVETTLEEILTGYPTLRAFIDLLLNVADELPPTPQDPLE